MLGEVKSGKRALYTNWMPREKKIQNFISEQEIQTGHVDGCKGMVAITKGCDNFCSFCIVPTTRGRLVSRELENILVEVEALIKNGAKEIQLLGQNVNSYQAGQNGFYELLRSVARLDGLQRLRFMSPHPNDWTHQLSDLMAEEPVICNQLHLPFQAGSDRILELMRRGHTAKEYLHKIDYLKKKIPEVSLGTDIIVGFPGETDSEFKETLKILREVNFSQVYAFKYSPRPDTKALALEDTVPTKIKGERLTELLELQDSLLQKKLRSFLHQKLEVLIENAHPQKRLAMSGRSAGNIPLVLPDCDLAVGTLITTRVTEVKAHSLVGEVVT
jgi:tRNA-2-methylthio-N6-dimethylallyladenosine synthase